MKRYLWVVESNTGRDETKWQTTDSVYFTRQKARKAIKLLELTMLFNRLRIRKYIPETEIKIEYRYVYGGGANQ